MNEVNQPRPIPPPPNYPPSTPYPINAHSDRCSPDHGGHQVGDITPSATWATVNRPSTPCSWAAPYPSSNNPLPQPSLQYAGPPHISSYLQSLSSNASRPSESSSEMPSPGRHLPPPYTSLAAQCPPIAPSAHYASPNNASSQDPAANAWPSNPPPAHGLPAATSPSSTSLSDALSPHISATSLASTCPSPATVASSLASSAGKSRPSFPSSDALPFPNLTSTPLAAKMSVSFVVSGNPSERAASSSAFAVLPSTTLPRASLETSRHPIASNSHADPNYAGISQERVLPIARFIARINWKALESQASKARYGNPCKLDDGWTVERHYLLRRILYENKEVKVVKLALPADCWSPEGVLASCSADSARLLEADAAGLELLL